MSSVQRKMMVTKSEKNSYRERLEKSLASPELQDQNTLKTLVRNQLQCTFNSNSEDSGFSEMVVTRRTEEVSTFLDLLRSASTVNNTSRSSEWKLKEEKEDYRVMYCPGPEGSPFHLLLVDGFVDSPVDHCLCVTWESTLYTKWWPNITMPPFKVTRSEVLQKSQLGEQLSIVRMKLPWPMATREAIVHYFLFEYVKEDLIIVVFNTVSDLDDLNTGTHGFTKDCIPEAKKVVRIGVYGGSVIQKVSPSSSYVRTIANVDTKMDFIPPFIINFISRTVVGKGFKLFQKTVASLYDDGGDFAKALIDPMYGRIRSCLEEQKRNDTVDHFTNLSLRKELTNDASPEIQEQAFFPSSQSSGTLFNGKAEPEETRADVESNGPPSESSNNGFTTMQANNVRDQFNDRFAIDKEENENGGGLIKFQDDQGKAAIVDLEKYANEDKTIVKPEVTEVCDNDKI